MKPLILTSATLVIILSQFTHPMIMVGIISLQSLLVCIIMSLLMQSPWFSFILFLVFMGGLMVLFIYISSLASNEQFEIFNLSFGSYLKMSIMLVTLSLLYLLMMNKTSMKMYNLNFKEVIFKIYSMEMTNIIIMTMLYLLLALIIVVKIITLKEGPLRPSR